MLFSIRCDFFEVVFLCFALHLPRSVDLGFLKFDLSEVGGYSSILFPIINTILAKICSLVYAECTLSVYSVYT